MKSICIIVPGKLPIPNIMGGAIETLVTLILDENEKAQRARFIVISAWEEGIIDATEKYKNSEFHYVRIKCVFLKKVINLINYIIAITTGNIDFFPSPFHWQVKKILKKVHADAVVVEHGVYKHFEFLLKTFERNQLYLHWHGTGPSPDCKTRKVFGHFIAVSEFVKHLYKYDFNGYDTQFHLVLNGIDEDAFKKRISTEEREIIRKQYNVQNDDLLIIYCGRLVKEKGVKELISAVIKANNPSIKLMIIGSSNFKNAKVTSYIQELQSIITNHENQIFFTGYIDNKELYKYYQCADIQVVCSIYEEAAGLVNIEGMMSGLPLIVTNSGGILEYADHTCSVVLDKGNSLYSNSDASRLSDQLANAFLFYNRNRDELKRLSKNSVTCAIKFTKEQFYNRFINIFT